MLTLGISYAVVLPCWALGLDWDRVIPLRLIVVFAPALSAFLATRIVDGAAGVNAWLARFGVWRVGFGWYALSLSIFLSLALAACIVRNRIDGTPVAFTDTPPAALLLGWIPLFLIPGLAEEPGWRAFLQSRLRRWFSAPVAGLLVGLLWGAWHAHDALMQPQRFGALTLGHFLVYLIGSSVIIGWLYDRSGQSLWIAMTAHLGSNLVWSVLPIFPDPGENPFTVLIYLALVWAVAIVLMGASAVRPER